MKKKFLLSASAIFCVVLMAAMVVSVSNKSGQFAFASEGGEWKHYSQSLPGTISGKENGVREYWVKCGGGYQFTAPGSGSITDMGTNYDLSGFAANDDRYIYPAKLTAQDILMSSSTKSLSLGTYADMTIQSITAGTFNLGTDPSALDVSGFAADHSDDGEKTVNVKGTKNGLVYYLSIPTTFVTAYVSDNATWVSNVVPSATGVTIKGYYKITADFTITGAPDWIYGWDKAIFSGTINGDNHKITLGQGAYGQFYVLDKATIKNATFTNNWWRRTTVNYGLFANKSIDSHFENITTNISGVKPEEIDTPYTPAANYGYLFLNGGAQRNSFKDCTFDFGKYDMPCLLSHSTNNTETNTFSNCLLKCYSYSELYFISGGSSVKKATGLTIKTSSVTPLELDNQDIFVNSEDTQSVSIAGTEYESDVVTKIEVGTYDLGTNLAALSIPASLKSTPADHGEKTMFLTVTHAGEEVKLSLPVTFVTGTITTDADIKALRGKNDDVASKVYGYYIVPANLTFGALGNASYAYDGTGNGFYGTLDGRGHTLTANTSQFTGGLFGTTCVGSTIKNVTLASNWFSGGWGISLIAHTMFTTTVENVTIKATAGNGVTATGNGLICSGAIYTCKFTDVKVESAVKLGTLIAQDANATKSTFTNCTVDSPAVLGIVGSDLTTPGWTIL